MNFKEIKDRLSTKTVGIAGAGGLGSNVAVALVRSGLGKLIIADFDVVEESNLNRQYYFRDQLGMPKVEALKDNLLRINPDLEIIYRVIKLDPKSIIELFHSADVLLEAFDAADQKEMLIETALSAWPDKPLIIGNGMAGFGKTELLEVKQHGNLFVCGDNTSEIAENNPPLAPRVGIVANMQANIALEILLNTKH